MIEKLIVCFIAGIGVSRGTSVFITTFTALTEAVSHFMIDKMPDMACLIF